MSIKKRITAVVIAVILMLNCAPCAFALEPGTVYYVDSVNGNDSNSGKSEQNAWKSIDKASSVTYVPGDSILFKAGGYFEGSFTAHGSGTADSPITLGAYGDAAKLGKPALTVKDSRTLIALTNVGGWCVQGLDLSAPESRAVLISASDCIVTDITVRDCDIHNVWLHRTETANGYNSAIFIAAVGLNTRIERLQLVDINIRDCAYGIHMGGNTIEFSPDTFVSAQESYSRDLLFENVDMYNIYYDGMAICSVNNLRIRNCALISTSLYTDYYTAPMWMHHANNVTVEYCEVAGATNTMDGMTVDFDGWTTNSTYQYIYSHDNVRFMQNCVYDNTTKNANCTVRYCLSVNDNLEPNNINLCNSPAYTDDDNPDYMDNFKFYNNTVINGSEFRFQNLRNSVIANNIFCGELSQCFVTSALTGDKEVTMFTGAFTNNCFHGCSLPLRAESSYNVSPMFAGDDYDDINSFILSSSSPLIGSGITVEGDMGAHDFFGNPLTDTHNIGCYEGEGIDDGQVITYDYNAFTAIINLLGRIYAMFVSINFWL